MDFMHTMSLPSGARRKEWGVQEQQAHLVDVEFSPEYNHLIRQVSDATKLKLAESGSAERAAEYKKRHGFRESRSS
eukprot:CAMPEP_0119331992 /NCGR_PEP_ID=MMETSP1333-20130426/81807_1 /TAXON_ID=418940 /ORGANISM="Scyphosphaera apsteinii, Strain RCC1455" /LENGTH=75 /DNA_ID=CAMNT_0007341721 /DNA_START=92 /DNA_END=319 /DNA_ORIENTATION=-